MSRRSHIQKWQMALSVVPLVALVIGLKTLAWVWNWQILDLNPLFTGLIAAAIFLLGFLISGILADYKESEKLPGEMAMSIETLFHEALPIYKDKKSAVAKDLMLAVVPLTAGFKDWFYRRQTTTQLMNQINALTVYFGQLESITQITYIAIMKENQTHLRRMLSRVETIRDTSFVASGYAIVEVTLILISLGLILVKVEPFYESLIYTGMVVFLLAYLYALIQNLDDPFEYTGKLNSLDEVSLAPLDLTQTRLNQIVASLDATSASEQGRS